MVDAPPIETCQAERHASPTKVLDDPVYRNGELTYF